MQSFAKIKSSRNGKITLSFTDIGISYQSCEFFNVPTMSFNAVCNNIFLVKISKFTIFMSNVTLLEISCHNINAVICVQYIKGKHLSLDKL